MSLNDEERSTSKLSSTVSELNRCLSILEEHGADTDRSSITRAITAEEVINRLRPRLKSLFL